MSGTDDLRFQMMGLGGPAAPAAPAPAAAPPKKGERAAGYPTFEGVLREKAKFDALVASVEKSMARLEEIAAKDGKAPADQKADARKALRAYDHALDLLRRGAELVAQIRKEQQAKAKAQGKKK